MKRTGFMSRSLPRKMWLLLSILAFFLGPSKSMAQLPTVTLVATDPDASETGDTGTFNVTRTGSTSTSLTVFYSETNSTALSGSDFVPLSGSVDISSGSASATITVTPINDTLVEGTEAVFIAIVDSPGNYVRGIPNSATVVIADDDSTNQIPFVSVVATDPNASEPGTDTGTFAVTRTGGTSTSLTVFYTVGGGSATNGTDYAALSGSVFIPAGSSSGTITVTPLDDTIVEGDETVVFTFSNNAAYLIGAPTTDRVTIADNDGAVPTVSISATDPNASEPGKDTGTFTVTRTGNTNNSLTVNYKLGGTANNGADYNALNGSVVIPAGSDSATIVVVPLDDSLTEGDETVVITLAGSKFYSVGKLDSATVTITDNDTLPIVAISATDAVASEPGTDTGTFTISRKGNASGDLTVNYKVGGGATNGTDYSTLSGSVVIPQGSSSVTLTVTPLDDTLIEGNETVVAALASSASYTVGTPSGATITIADDDTATPIVSLSANDPNASEPGSDTGSFTITRSGSTSAALTVNFSVSGTATAGTDYGALASPVTIPAGASSAVLTVTPLDDALVEGDETVVVTLANSVAYTVGSPSTATVTIADDDTLPTITISATDAVASEPGTDTGAFTIVRSGSTGAGLTVNYTVSGTARNGSDYATLSGSINIPAGSSSVAILVTPIDDDLVETAETVTVTLSNSPSYTVASPSNATVTIADNDSNTQPLRITSATPLPAGTYGTNYLYSFSAEGGTLPYSWTQSGGTLPAGLAVTSAGEVSGTPSAMGDFTFLIRVMDGTQSLATQEFALNIGPPTPNPVTIDVSPNTPAPAQQPNISVGLPADFPLAVTGRLTLTFTPDAVIPSDDPAIVFSNGTRVLQFSKDPGRDVQFADAPSFSMGTVAGNISVSLSLQAGSIDITPSPAPTQTVSINRTPPTISSVSICSQAASSFEVIVTGFSTPRQVNRVTLTFRAVGNTILEGGTFSVSNIGSEFERWYRSEASQQHGSRFTLRVPFTFQQGSLSDLSSVSVTLANDVGVSDPPVIANFSSTTSCR